MSKYSRGNVEAFEILYRRYKGASYRYFKRQCRTQQETEDLMQELWSRVIKAKYNYQQSALFATWFYHIAHNLLVDHHKRLVLVTDDNSQSNDDLFEHDTNSLPEQKMRAHQQAMKLRKCMNKLPSLQLEVFLIKEEAGLTMADIAKVVDASVEATKSRLRYAISSLKKCLGGHYNE
ncbi:MAG: sigma-70 family RNA polymerase sigma factor [Psychrobium sp.]|nr:sigma-70 family RNA polymerase sigma factor [Psychrobium sp.]